MNGGSTDVAEYWDGSTKEFETNRLRFRPGYNQLEANPLVLSSELVYRDLGSDGQPLTSQTLLVDDQLTVVTISGDVDANSLSTELVVVPVSTSTQRVTVTGDGGSLNLTVPTGVSAATWQSKLLANNPHVLSVTDVPGGVQIELDGSKTYDLRLAQVTIRERNSAGGITNPGPHYVVRHAGHNSSLSTSQTVELTAEVRDRFNNPVSGVDVTFTNESGATTTVTTTEQGRATLSYSPTATGSENVTATFDGGGIARKETVFTVYASESGASSDSYGITLDNGYTTGVLLDYARLDGVGGIDARFNNTASKDWTAIEVRLTEYFVGQSEEVTRLDFDGTTLTVHDDYTPLNTPYTISAGGTKTIKIDNFEQYTGESADPGSSHLIFFTVVYEDSSGNTDVATYITQIRPSA